MKIFPGPTPKTPVVDPQQSESTVAKGKVSQNTFQEILAKKQSQEVQAANEVHHVGEFPDIVRTNRLQEQALSFADQSLDLLAHLEGLLKAPSASSEKAIGQVKAVLDEHVQGLIEIQKDLSPEDPLRETINEIGVKMAVEAYKIQRGDYNGG